MCCSSFVEPRRLSGLVCCAHIEIDHSMFHEEKTVANKFDVPFILTISERVTVHVNKGRSFLSVFSFFSSRWREQLQTIKTTELFPHVCIHGVGAVLTQHWRPFFLILPSTVSTVQLSFLPVFLSWRYIVFIFKNHKSLLWRCQKHFSDFVCLFVFVLACVPLYSKGILSFTCITNAQNASTSQHYILFPPSTKFKAFSLVCLLFPFQTALLLFSLMACVYCENVTAFMSCSLLQRVRSDFTFPPEFGPRCWTERQNICWHGCTHMTRKPGVK